jgi:aryl-alcohol dehydrogenase-like predicted oxidoreductase
MRYREIGRSGLRVSAVGLGSWLTYGGTVGEATARQCIAHAYDRGVTFFDTANVYARGRAETVMGRALSAYPRESYVIATKVYFPMGPGHDDRGLSRKHVWEQCHESLRRLGVETIDLYQCHRFDDETPLEETCAVMNDLVAGGKIRHWGVSEWSAGEIRAVVELCQEAGCPPPISNQPEYNALQRRIEDDVLPMTKALGLGNVVWSPIAQGVLTGKYGSHGEAPAGSRAASEAGGFMGRYLDEDVLEAVEAFRRIADDAGLTPAQLAVAWCLRRPEVSSAIVGATATSHVEENVAAAELDPGADVFAAVDQALGSVQVEGV